MGGHVFENSMGLALPLRLQWLTRFQSLECDLSLVEGQKKPSLPGLPCVGKVKKDCSESQWRKGL